MIEIYKEFTFEAAHQLGANVAKGHPYSRLHGHSYKAEVHVRGTPDARTGWIADLGAIEAAIAPVRERLDHHYLNEVDGLGLPTLENISRWIWEQLKPAIPQLHRIVLRRATCGDGCVYQPAD